MRESGQSYKSRLRLTRIVAPEGHERRAGQGCRHGVYITDDTIRRKIMPQELFVRRTPAGSVEVMARIANCTDKPIQIEGRTSFMDEQKFPTEDASAWQTVFLQLRSMGTYREVSIGGANVAYYLIEVTATK